MLGKLLVPFFNPELKGLAVNNITRKVVRVNISLEFFYKISQQI